MLEGEKEVKDSFSLFRGEMLNGSNVNAAENFGLSSGLPAVSAARIIGLYVLLFAVLPLPNFVVSCGGVEYVVYEQASVCGPRRVFLAFASEAALRTHPLEANFE